MLQKDYFSSLFKLYIILLFINLFLPLGLMAGEINLKSIPIAGLGKNIFVIFISLCFSLPYIDILKSINSDNKNLYRNLFLSPLFIWWILMFLYLLLYELIVSEFISMNLFIVIYICSSLLLFYFQKLNLIKQKK